MATSDSLIEEAILKPVGAVAFVIFVLLTVYGAITD